MSLSYVVVRPGDQLFRILGDHYGQRKFLEDREAVIAAVLQNNPQIGNIDRIFPGQVFALPEIPTSAQQMPVLPLDQARAAGNVCTTLTSADPMTVDLIRQTSDSSLMSDAGSGMIDFVGKATERAAKNTKAVKTLYQEYKSTDMTRGSYDYKRRVLIRKVDHSLGPLRPLITPGQLSREVIRVKPQAIHKTAQIEAEVKQLNRITKLAKHGGVILKIAEVGGKAVEIHHAPGNARRTDILIDFVGGAAGAAGGAVLFVAVFGTPAGWVAIGGMVVASAVTGAVGEQVAKSVRQNTLVDKNGVRINTKADRLWAPLYGQ